MKKIIFLFALLLTLVCAVMVLTVSAESAEPTPSEGLKFTSNGNGTCYVSDIGTCTDTDVVIPSTSPNGDTVTGIGIYAFYYCTGLTSIEIPSSVTSIGDSAFSSCTDGDADIILDCYKQITFYDWANTFSDMVVSKYVSVRHP